MVQAPVGSARERPTTTASSRPRRVSQSALCVFVLALLLAAALPSASASGARLSDPQTFNGQLHIPAEGTPTGQFLLFSGKLQMEGTFSGPVFGVQTQAGSAIEGDVVRVYRSSDHASIAQKVPAFEFPNATLTPDDGAAFFWSVPDGTVAAAPEFTFAFLYNIEANLPKMEALIPPRDGPAPPSLIGQASDAPWTIAAPGDERSLYYPLSGGFTITASNGTTQHFEARDWLVTIHGETTAQIQAAGLAVPFEEGNEAHLSRASPAAFANGFSVSRLQGFLGVAAELAEGFEPPADLPDEEIDPACVADPRSCAGNLTAEEMQAYAAMHEDGGNETDGENATAPKPESPPREDTRHVETLPAEALGALESLAPLLNGAFLGLNGAEIQSGEASSATAGFSLVRYTSLTLSAQDAETVGYGGEAPFLFTDGHVQHDESVIRAGPIVIPILSAFLYLIAIGAYAATRVQTFRPLDEELTRKLWAPALISQWALLLVGFLLFDAEVRYVLGESLLGTLGFYGGGTTAAQTAHAGTMALTGPALILTVQMALWGAASLAFGLPITIIARSALKAGGLGKPTYGFALGIGAIFTWLLGTGIILPVLDVLFGSIAGAA